MEPPMLLKSLEFPLLTSAAKWHLPGIQPGGSKNLRTSWTKNRPVVEVYYVVFRHCYVCTVYIYICKYVSCKHKLLIWYQGPNCWFFIHVLFFSFKINSWEKKTIDVSAKNPGSKKIASQNLLPGCLVMKVGWSFLLSWQQSNPLRKGILAWRYGTEFQSTSPPWSPLNHHWTINWNYYIGYIVDYKKVW